MASKPKLSKPVPTPLPGPNPLPLPFPPIELPWPRPPWWDDILRLYTDCNQRILIVTDGALNFSAGSAFGLTELIAALGSGAPGFMPVTITTAHRAGGGGATHTNFRFDAPPVPLTRANFDQLWMFGIASGTVRNTVAGTNAAYSPGNGLNNAEIAAISAFMDAGGGVFATGDHATLGFAMCGTLPRVRQMRNWTSVPMGLETTLDANGQLTALRRIDTLADPMSNTDYEFDDQSDVFPQRLYPHYRQTTAGGSWVPHPLLSSPTRVIDVFPDHPHESECTVAANPAGAYTEAGLNFPEFPGAGASQPVEVVASSMSGGRFLGLSATNAAYGKPPVNPRSFGAISAYNGDAASRGRIVCDSTWHHFVNVNLNGVGTPFVGGLGSVRTGFVGVPDVYNQIKRYYSNIARWLAPVGRRRCRLFLDLVDIRFNTMLIEELPIPVPNLPDPPPWPLLRQLGVTVRSALASRVGDAMADQMINEVLLDPELAKGSLAVLSLGKAEPGLFDFEGLRFSLLGGFMHYFAAALPGTPEELVGKINKKNSHRLIDEVIEAAVQKSQSQVGPQVLESARRDLQRLERLAGKGK